MVKLTRVADWLTTWKSTLTGAIERLLRDKLDEEVSVLDFGVVGDGVTDDTAAMQLAVNNAKHLKIPANCTIKLTSPVTLPAESRTIRGCGRTSIITGTASSFINFNSAYQQADGSFITNFIESCHFIMGKNQTGINASSTWQGTGKAPHRIECNSFTFKHATADCRGSIGILLRGIWSAHIYDNDCYYVPGSYAVKDALGYGGTFIKIDCATTTVAGCVMNLIIARNSTVHVTFPIASTPRAQQTGGRIEGIKIVDNNFVAGRTAVQFNQTLALNITGNQFSDFYRPILLDGCFHTTVSANTEITGDDACIICSSTSNSFAENISITGNNIFCQANQASATGIVFIHNYGSGAMRAITVTGNTIGGQAAMTHVGIQVIGSAPVIAMSITDNAFNNLSACVNIGNKQSTNRIKISGNSYGNISVLPPNNGMGHNQERPVYEHSINQIVTTGSGTSSATINIDVSAAGFYEKPLAGSVTISSSAEGIYGTYDYDNSTTTTARFNLWCTTGTFGSGVRRFTGILRGYSTRAE